MADTSLFVVSCGEYSAKDIVAIFSDKIKADNLACLVEGDVEEWCLDAPMADDPGLDFYELELNRDGEMTAPSKMPRLNDNGQRHRERVYLRTHKDDSYERKSYWRLYWRGYAKGEEHARRAAEELRRQILAGQHPACVDFGKN